MTVIASTDLIAELDHTLKAGPPSRQIRILRKVAGLFLEDAHRLSDDLVELFDGILLRLMDDVELPTLTTLSRSLADTGSVPTAVARRLANHDDPDVAAPILQKCGNLSEADLVDIAWLRAEGHLFAIAGRALVSEQLTDVLLMRGDSSVLRALAANHGARITTSGFAMLVDAAGRDDDVACSLVKRDDLPPGTLNELIGRATQRQQAHLLKNAPPSVQATIRAAIDARAVCAETAPPVAIDYTEAKAKIMVLNQTGQLNDSSVNRFAVRGEYRNVVAALAQLATVPTETIETLLKATAIRGIAIACRASRLNWNTTRAIVMHRKPGPVPSQPELDETEAMFETLPLSNAQRMIRFGSISELTAPSSAAGRG